MWSNVLRVPYGAGYIVHVGSSVLGIPYGAEYMYM